MPTNRASTIAPSTEVLAGSLAALLATAGVLHFRRPKPFDTIVPPALPGPARAYTYGSGVAELAVAGLLAVPATRPAGGAAAAALFVAVFPANLQMAWDWRHRSPRARAIAFGRLPLQGVLVWAADRVRRGAGPARPWPARPGPR